MSNISNSTLIKILKYWYKKLSGNQHRTKFLLTKIFEFLSFSKSSNRVNNNYEFEDFPVPKRNNLPENPILSLVVPVYINSKKDIIDLTNLLSSLEKQTKIPDYVVLIDDGSPISFKPPNCVLLHKLYKNSGPATARNIGKKIALGYKSDIIVFADIDCILSENWIAQILSNFKSDDRFHILSGNTFSVDKHWFGTYHEINGTLNGRKFINCEQLLYGTTANLAITNDVAAVIDFNERFPLAAGEDIEFCFKSNKAGFAIKHIPTMIVFHHFGYNHNLLKSFGRFRKLFYKYSRGEEILVNQIPEYYAFFEKSQEITANLNNIKTLGIRKKKFNNKFIHASVSGES